MNWPPVILGTLFVRVFAVCRSVYLCLERFAAMHGESLRRLRLRRQRG